MKDTYTKIDNQLVEQKHKPSQGIINKPSQICMFIKTSGIEQVRVSMIHF